MLRGLDKRLSRKTDLPVYLAEAPLKAVVRGTGIALKNLEKLKILVSLSHLKTAKNILS